MRIKHYAGYGCVNAIKIHDKNCDLHICVYGNHERGLVRDDKYDIFNWLVRRFDKSIESARQISDYKIVSKYDQNIHAETCDYLINFVA